MSKTSLPLNYRTSIRSEMIPFIPAHYERVLEVGCGEGRFANNLKGIQHEYWGIELDPTSATIASNHLTKVLTGDVFSMLPSVPNNYFDLIVCNDVIEHLSSEVDFLTLIKEKMIHKGCIIGSIPNVRHVGNIYELLFKKDWEYKDVGILDRTHLRFFTEKSLRRTFERASLQIEILHGINDNQVVHEKIARRIQKVMPFILGNDIRYLQFGFRVRKDAA